MGEETLPSLKGREEGKKCTDADRNIDLGMG